MTATPAEFRAKYPQFDASGWPDSVVEQALCDGDAETGGSGWGVYEDACGNFKQRGQFAYAAHWLSVTFPTGISGVTPGASRNAVSSKSVGDESIGYAVATPVDSGTSWLTSTQFGQQFIRLRRRAGMGARAV